MYGDWAKQSFEYLLRDELEGEPKNLKGDQWRVLGRVIYIQYYTFFMVESMGIHGGKERWKEGGEGVFTVWVEKDLGEMIEEREGRDKEIDSIYPTGCSRATPVRSVTPGSSQ
jgi:hypothetical protein